MKTFSKNDTLAIRGIAIVLLIFHHNFRSKSVYEGFTCSFFPFSEDKVVLFCNFLKICVGMFAFLSAYGLTLSLKKYNKNSVLTGRQYSHFLSNRIFNLLWGFWFIFIPCEIINWFVAPQYTLVYFTHGMVQGSVNVLLDFLGIAKLFGTPQLNGTWWYMSLAIVILMVVPFMSKLCEKYNSFCVTLFLLALPRIMSLAFSLKVGEDSNCFRWMFAALLGVIAAKYNWLARLKSFTITSNRVVSKIIKFVVLTIILIVFYIIRGKTGGNYSNYVFEFRDGIVPAFIVYYCYEFLTDIPGLKQLMILIGKNSLNIFLFHTFIRQRWLKAYTYSFDHFVLISLVLLAESVIVSIVIELLKKILHYNNLRNFIMNKVNKKYYSDVTFSTSK